MIWTVFKVGNDLGVAPVEGGVVPEGSIILGTTTDPNYLTNVAAASAVNLAATRVISKWFFRRRFTNEERVLIDNAEFDVDLSPEHRAIFRTMNKDFDAVSEINLDDPAIIDALNFMVATGKLAQPRIAEIRS